MKKLKIEHIFSYIFVFIITFFMLAVMFRFFGSRLFHINFEDNAAENGIDSSTSSEGISWETLYPFDEKYTFDYQKTEEPELETDETSKYLAIADALKWKTDYYTSNLLFGRMKFVEANALFNKNVGMKIITGTDSVVALSNGYLTFESYETNTEYAAESLEWFDGILKEKNINFMYIQFPIKQNPNDNKLPAGLTDYANINADSLLERLDKTDVNHIDFREVLNAHTDDWYSSFYRTDHHWKAETGVWASGEIANILNKNFGYSIDEGIGNLDNYNVKVYEDFSLGSQGKITTLRFTDPEDFSLITPKKATDFTVSYQSEYDGTGSFDKVLTDSRIFEKKDYYNVSAYSTYLYGNHAITSIKNNNVHNGKRLLVLSDSFCKCVVPFLAQEIEYIDVIDRRYFTGSVINYIDTFKPDTVIAAYNPTMITTSSAHNSMFNFE